MTAAWLALAGCSSPTDPCARSDEGVGRPSFDLASALRGAGAEVEWLGYRLDLTLLSAPTQVLAVNGAEVLMWEYCTPDQLSQDLGLYGIGIHRRNPPVLVLAPDHHLFTLAEVMARYHGSDGSIVDLLTLVMGPEARP